MDLDLFLFFIRKMTRDNKEHRHFHEFGKGNDYSDFGDNFLVKSLRVPERTF